MGNLVHPAPEQFTAAQLQVDPILRYFHFAHLPAALREISEPFCALAGAVIASVPRNAERTVALRKLLEAKDAAVRANVPSPTIERTPTFFHRLLVESRELEERKEKLAEFITNNPGYAKLPADQRTLMTRQFEAMAEYAATLAQRIAMIPADQRNEFDEAAPVEGEIKVTGGDKSETPVPFGGETMTDKSRNGGTNKPANRTATADQVGTKPGAKSTANASGTEGDENGKPLASHSGLDISGQFRVDEKISIGVRGSDIVLTQSHSGREVVVAEAALTYFVDKVD